MATSLEEKTKFARQLDQLVQHFDLDSATLTSLETLFGDLAALESAGIERHRDIGASVQAWIEAQ